MHTSQLRGARAVVVAVAIALFSTQGLARELVILDPPAAVLPVCGSQNAPPFAPSADASHRPCGPREARQYTPHNRGVGFKILDLESEACFVPDGAYRLLDAIVDEARRRVRLAGVGTSAILKAQLIGRVTGEIMKEKGFALSLPTDTLGDALVARGTTDKKARHVFDCDTGSMIYLTVAEALSAPASLVEITLPNGDQHNYVQWHVAHNRYVAWDPNAQAQCIAPATSGGYQGKSLSYRETISYARTLRADLWIAQKNYDRAIEDYRAAIRLFPQRPGAYAGLAWMLATIKFGTSARYRRLAVESAKYAVRLRRNADNLDTLACAYAFAGDFNGAVIAEKAALRLAPTNGDYSLRMQTFDKRRDCGPAN